MVKLNHLVVSTTRHQPSKANKSVQVPQTELPTLSSPLNTRKRSGIPQDAEFIASLICMRNNMGLVHLYNPSKKGATVRANGTGEGNQWFLGWVGQHSRRRRTSKARDFLFLRVMLLEDTVKEIGHAEIDYCKSHADLHLVSQRAKKSKC